MNATAIIVKVKSRIFTFFMDTTSKSIIYFVRVKCDSGSQAGMSEGVREDDGTE